MATILSRGASMAPPPPPPTTQTSSTGPSSSSPQLGFQKAPSISRRHSGTTVSGATTNSATGRPARNSKDTQRQSQARSMSMALGVGAEGQTETLLTKDPYVRTDKYILEKFKDCPPSLIIHLHSTYFRFDQQDGTFPYNSPMKIILEHVRAKTIPHEILEELEQGNVRYYEGCLIVEIQDHKSSGPASGKAYKEQYTLPAERPFSIHKQWQYLTPSAYVPYPSPQSTPRASASPIGEGDKIGAAPGSSGPRTFTTVLHPTALSRHRDIAILATTMLPEVRAGNKKSQAAIVRDAGTPPTPLFAVQGTSAAIKANNQKRRRMRLEEEELHQFEAEILRRTEPMLFLDPAGSLEDCRAILKSLTHPQHDHDPPLRAGRKRTFAELAADEAQAAEEERVALVGDPRLQPSLGVAGANQSAAAEAGDAAKQTDDFRWAKQVEDIKEEHAAAKLRKTHEDAVKKDEESREKQRRVEEEREARERERLKREQMEKQARVAQIQAAAAAAAQLQVVPPSQTPSMQNANLIHPQMLHAHKMMMQQQQQQQQQHHQLQQQQQQQQHQEQHNQMPGHMNHGSPMMASRMSMSSSPAAGHPALGHGGVPMAFQMSNQGPLTPRPGSAMQTQPMGRQSSQQHSLLGHSRTSTPQVPTATPQMANSMPVQNMTPQRMHQGSPQAGMMNGIPNGVTNGVQNGMQNGMQNGLQNGVANGLPTGMNPMQQQQYMQMQLHQRQQMQARQQQQRAALAAQMQQGSPGQSEITQAQYRQRLGQQLAAQQQSAKMREGMNMANGNAGTSAGAFPSAMAAAPSMSRGPSQQQFAGTAKPQMPNQPMNRVQGQIQQAGTPQRPQFPNGNAGPSGGGMNPNQVAQYNQYIQVQKQLFLQRIRQQHGGNVPQDWEVQFNKWLTTQKQLSRAKQLAAQQAQQAGAAAQMQAMGRVPSQGQQQQQQQQQQQAFGNQMANGGQMMPGPGQQGMQGEQSPEYLARLMQHKQQILRAQAASQLGRAGMNGHGMQMQMPQGRGNG